MTIINVLKTADAAILISDTKLTAAGRGDMGNVNKIHPLPHLSAAIATRGKWNALEKVARMVVPKASSFADLRRILTEDLRGLATAAALRGEGLIDDTDVVVIGWDDGPQAFVVDNHGRHGTPAWEVAEIEHAMATPTVDSVTFNALSEDGYNQLLVMNAIVQAQAREHDCCGGAVIMTAVHANGITMMPFGAISDDARSAA